MNRLLLEYLDKILSENPSFLGEDGAKKPGDVWDTDVNWAGKNQEGKIEYFPKTNPNSQQLAYAWARGLTGTQAPTEEPASADTSPIDEPQDDPVSVEDENFSFSTEEALRVADALEEKLPSLGGGKNQQLIKQRIKEIIEALRSGDQKRIIDAVINSDPPVRLSGNGRIAFGASKKKLYFTATEEKSLNNDFFNILRRIPTLNNIFASDVEVNREAFKPSSLFTDEDEPIIHEDGRGITLRNGGTEGNNVDIREVDIDDEAVNVRVEEIIEENPQIKEALGKCSGNIECEANIKERIAGAVRRKRQAHNKNVQSIINCEQTRRNMTRQRTPRNSCVRVLKSGQDGISEILSMLHTKAAELGLGGNAVVEEAINAFSELGAIDSPVTKEKIEAVLAKIMKKLENSPLRSAVPYMGELIAAAILTSMGQTTMIPTSGEFPVADVFSLMDSPLLGGQELRAIMVDIGIEPTEGGPDGLVFRFGNWSVKLDGGGASGTLGKMEYTEFDSAEVANTLTTLAGLHSTAEGGIFDNGHRGPPRPTKPGRGASQKQKDAYERKLEEWKETRKKARGIVEENLNKNEETIMATLSEHEADVRAYYGFPETSPPTLKKIAQMLSTGTRLTCGPRGIPIPGRENSINIQARGNNSLNGRMWALASLNGFLTEAIHNRRATRQQYYGFMASRGSGNFTITDGKYTMLAMSYQHYKDKRTSEEYVVPNGGQNALTVPMSVDEMRTMGNPCSGKTNEGICEDNTSAYILEEVLRILKDMEI